MGDLVLIQPIPRPTYTITGLFLRWWVFWKPLKGFCAFSVSEIPVSSSLYLDETRQTMTRTRVHGWYLRDVTASWSQKSSVCTANSSPGALLRFPPGELGLKGKRLGLGETLLTVQLGSYKRARSTRLWAKPASPSWPTCRKAKYIRSPEAKRVELRNKKDSPIALENGERDSDLRGLTVTTPVLGALVSGCPWKSTLDPIIATKPVKYKNSTT